MNPKRPQIGLYVLVLGLSLFLVVVALGGGAFGSDAHWVAHWQRRAFSLLCHQDPGRSFWVGGSPMAVCSRCFGIYSFFTLTWLALPLWKRWEMLFHKHIQRLFFWVIVLNLVDVFGDLAGFLENTTSSRFLLGVMIGLAAALFLGIGFQLKNDDNKRGFNYGADGTTLEQL